MSEYTQFRSNIGNVASTHDPPLYIQDYESFKDTNFKSSSFCLLKFFIYYYNEQQKSELLYVRKTICFNKGDFIKPYHDPLNYIFIIVEGRMGSIRTLFQVIFVFHIYIDSNSEIKKKLLHIMKSKDIIGDFDQNFIALTSMQYETLTQIETMKFLKIEYVKVMRDVKKKRIIDKAKYLAKCLIASKHLNDNEIKTLAKYAKKKHLIKMSLCFLKALNLNECILLEI